MDWVKELGRKNVQDLITMIQWNEDNVRILYFFLRIFSSPNLNPLHRTSVSFAYLQKCSLLPPTRSTATLSITVLRS